MKGSNTATSGYLGKIVLPYIFHKVSWQTWKNRSDYRPNNI